MADSPPTRRSDADALETHRWQRAASLAARFHAGHLRKDGRTPYIAHPFRVALVIRDVFGIEDEAVLAAALLHDVIEDTPADYDDVARACGTDVADLVAAMSKDMTRPHDRREPEYDDRLRRSEWRARLLKLADVYDNLCDADPGPRRRRAIDKAERALLLAADDEPLRGAADRLRAIVEQARRLEGDESASAV